CHWDLSSPDAETIRKLALTRELARRGHEVLLLAPDLGRAPRERWPRGARIVYAPTLGGRFAAHLYALTAFPLLLLLALTRRPDAETIRKLALPRELARRAHDVLLLAPGLGRAPRERWPRGARIVYAPTLGGRFAAHPYALTAFPLLLLLALTRRPDAVYVTD